MGGENHGDAIRGEKSLKYILLLPCIAFLLAITIYPLIFSFVISLRDYCLIDPSRPFAGFANYWKLLTDSCFWISLRVTVVFAAASILLTFALGMVIALVLNSCKIRGKAWFQTLFILPTFLPSVVTGRVWRALYNPNYGWVNYFLRFVGLPSQNWLGNPQLVLPAAVWVDVWTWTPFTFLLLYAGLCGVPQEPREAAKVDGASNWQLFRHITLPYLRPIILLTLLFRIADSFRVFGSVFTLTKGGPGLHTEVLSLSVYRWGFMRLDLGTSSATSFLTLFLVVIITMWFIRRLYKSITQ